MLAQVTRGDVERPICTALAHLDRENIGFLRPAVIAGCSHVVLPGRVRGAHPNPKSRTLID